MSLYTGTADYYLKYRYGYSPVYYQEIFAACGLNDNSVVMDLACGPGIVALDIAPKVRKVIAVDIEDEFLEAGQAEAEKRGIKNIEWHKLRAEDITTLGKMVDAVIISHAFHWLERETVASLVYRMLLPGGSIILASDNTSPRWTTPEVMEKVKSLIGEKGLYIMEAYRKIGEKKHQEVLTEAGFKLQEMTVDCGHRTTTPERVLGWYLSTSYANPQILGTNLEKFKKEIGTMLQSLPKEAFEEEIIAKAIIGFK